jgi:hypothetical protein
VLLTLVTTLLPRQQQPWPLLFQPLLLLPLPLPLLTRRRVKLKHDYITSYM